MGFLQDFWYGVTHPLNPFGNLTPEEVEELRRQGVLKPSLLQRISDMWDATMGNIIKFFPMILLLALLFVLWKVGILQPIVKSFTGKK